MLFRLTFDRIVRRDPGRVLSKLGSLLVSAQQMKEVPTFKMISQSVLIDRMKINGSLARVAITHLTREGLIKPLIHHNGQLVYS